MEFLFLGLGVMLVGELYKFLCKKFTNQTVAWWLMHLFIFTLSVIVVVARQVIPEEVLAEVIKIAGAAVILYETLWKRVVAPVIGTEPKQ